MASSNYFFWLKPVERILFGSFWWVFLMLVVFSLPFLRPWWWLFAPIFLSLELRVVYMWWIQWDYNYAKIKWYILEIVPPKEILVPIKAMEDFFTVIWPNFYAPPSWRERMCEGALPSAASWMSFEIVSIEGRIHFYFRVSSAHRPSVEAALYAHYPELEIQEVSDYTKNVPQNVPNETWDAYGEDFILQRPAPYPIKTYEKFFEPQGEKISAEEKRIDPIASLLESMAKLGSGEQFWLQFITMSVGDNDEPDFKKEGQHIISKLAKRPEKKKKSGFDWFADIPYHLIFGPKKEGSGEKATYKWLDRKEAGGAAGSTTSEDGEREMVMTPGEKEIMTEVENKMKKPLFRTVIRSMYIAKRENFSSPNKILTRSYFAHFIAQNLNVIVFSKVTRPKTQYVFRKRIPYIRTRRLFRNYVLRFTPLFPNRQRECALLNTEEMATVFHFPIKVTGMTMPTMTRIESKKGGAPSNLPIE
jgi:hypothetical protein